jgi:hypothetical protein
MRPAVQRPRDRSRVVLTVTSLKKTVVLAIVLNLNSKPILGQNFELFYPNIATLRDTANAVPAPSLLVTVYEFRTSHSKSTVFSSSRVCRLIRSKTSETDSMSVNKSFCQSFLI